jgi:ornithine racemase
MAFLNLYRERLFENYQFLRKKFEENGVEWGVVSKILCGNRKYIKELIDFGVVEIHDSRISNLAKVKEINPAVQTVYIKPPSKRNLAEMVTYADVSLNSELDTIRWISEEAVRQDKIHKIIIMVETGDLREGVMADHLLDFYSKVFDLPGLEIIGLGTNLHCLNGVMPSSDKLIQLSLYKQIIELKFSKEISWVSAGTSVTIPLMLNKQLPKGINHFRVGETLYFGIDLFEGTVIAGMHGDVFELFAEIIEMQEKPLLPSGTIGTNPQGKLSGLNENLYGKTSCRAILDIGLLDMDPKYLIPEDEDYEILGVSSDMLILNLGENPKKYKVGDLITFRLKYMGALAILNSSYIEKRLV